MEIEIGEYVRTYFGEIGKCIDKSFESCVIDFNKEDYEEFFEDEFEEEIKEHSKNIIDLIEEGDYVNGLEVYEGKVASGAKKLLVKNHIINGMALEVINIKTIVTKEQFKSVEYKI